MECCGDGAEKGEKERKKERKRERSINILLIATASCVYLFSYSPCHVKRHDRLSQSQITLFDYYYCFHRTVLLLLNSKIGVYDIFFIYDTFYTASAMIKITIKMNSRVSCSFSFLIQIFKSILTKNTKIHIRSNLQIFSR
jgi:hypothetical protein